jgi:hypothetical protein
MSKQARCRPSWKKRTSRKARRRRLEVGILELTKMLETGNSGVLINGAALQMEDLDWTKMTRTTYETTHINLRKNRGVLYV